MSNSKQRPYEQEKYPASPEIVYYGDRKFNYTVIQEGIYPPVAQINYTEAPNYFPIPDNYIIKTTWGRANNCRTIQCSIYYIEGNPHYLIFLEIIYNTKLSRPNLHLTFLLNYIK